MRFSAGISTPSSLGIKKLQGYKVKSYSAKNPKSETISKLEVRILKTMPLRPRIVLNIGSFGFVSDFDIRIFWRSSLPLLMARVFADHVQHVLALHDPATGTKSFY